MPDALQGIGTLAIGLIRLTQGILNRASGIRIPRKASRLDAAHNNVGIGSGQFRQSPDGMEGQFLGLVGKPCRESAQPGGPGARQPIEAGANCLQRQVGLAVRYGHDVSSGFADDTV